VRPEDARATYGGALFVATSSVSSGAASVTLSTVVRDISAVTGDPASDGSPGDIRRATVTFVDRSSGGPPLCQAPVALVSPGDLTTGTATCTWNADIGSADSLTFRVGIVVGGDYVRDAATEDTTVTISRPVATMFITGGGYIVNVGSAGLFPGDPGARTNAGFNVRYNKSATNLKGHVTVIVRSGGRTYQVRGNALTSLATQACRSGPASAGCPSSATLLSRANIQDVSDPAAAVALDGNATVQLTVTDRGEPGSADSIAIVVRDKDGRLWSASAWTGSAAIERPLAGGNLVAH
jgi:hypothetical protein